MIWERLGDTAILLRDLEAQIPQVDLPGVVATVPAFATACIHYNPALVSAEQIIEAIRWEAPPPASARRTHSLPFVWLDGPDWPAVAAILNQPIEELQQQILESPPFLVEAVGFQAGFPYCTGLPPLFRDLPRKDKPEPRIEPGTLAIAAGMVGVYPSPSPGGWWQIGRTPLQIVGPDFFPIAPGDQLRLTLITQAEAESLAGQRLGDARWI